MRLSDIPFKTTDWSKIEPTEHKGERGLVYWRTQQFGSVRVRMLECTPGYVSDHWVTKGTSSFALKVNYALSYKMVAYLPSHQGRAIKWQTMKNLTVHTPRLVRSCLLLIELGSKSALPQSPLGKSFTPRSQVVRLHYRNITSNLRLVYDLVTLTALSSRLPDEWMTFNIAVYSSMQSNMNKQEIPLR